MDFLVRRLHFPFRRYFSSFFSVESTFVYNLNVLFMENIENFLAEDFVLDVQTVCVVEPISFFDFDDMELVTIRTVTSSKVI